MSQPSLAENRCSKREAPKSKRMKGQTHAEVITGLITGVNSGAEEPLLIITKRLQ
jgi:hypothetical protein